MQLREKKSESHPSEYGAYMTKPDPFGQFDVILNDTTVSGNYSLVDDRIMSINVRRDGGFLKILRDYSWKCVRFVNNTMSFQLEFTRPFAVSNQDTLEVSFRNTSFFEATSGRNLESHLLLKD